MACPQVPAPSADTRGMRALFKTSIALLSLTLCQSAFADWESKEVTVSRPQKAPVFTYKNTGKTPAVLVLTNSQSDCGDCKVTKYTREPIAPGKEGTVHVLCRFKDKGHFHKVVASGQVKSGKDTQTFQLKVRSPAK